MASIIGPKSPPRVSCGQTSEFTETLGDGMEFIGPTPTFFSGETLETWEAAQPGPTARIRRVARLCLDSVNFSRARRSCEKP